jgi:hypothetical protein
MSSARRAGLNIGRRTLNRALAENSPTPRR